MIGGLKTAKEGKQESIALKSVQRVSICTKFNRFAVGLGKVMKDIFMHNLVLRLQKWAITKDLVLTFVRY